MSKYYTIDDFIKYNIYNTDNNKLIIISNKFEDICNIYIYDIIERNKLYYLYYGIDNYNYKDSNIIIHYHINKIEKKLNNDISYDLIDTFKTLHNLLDYLNNQFKRIHKSHYFLNNTNINRVGTSYYIHNISHLLYKK